MSHTKTVFQNQGEVARLQVMNASSLVADDLWEAIEPLLPDEPPKPNGGASARRRPRRPRWHRLRSADRLPVAAAAQRTRLRQRDDLLAPAAGLAGSRCLGAA